MLSRSAMGSLAVPLLACLTLGVGCSRESGADQEEASDSALTSTSLGGFAAGPQGLYRTTGTKLVRHDFNGRVLGTITLEQKTLAPPTVVGDRVYVLEDDTKVAVYDSDLTLLQSHKPLGGSMTSMALMPCGDAVFVVQTVGAFGVSERRTAGAIVGDRMRVLDVPPFGDWTRYACVGGELFSYTQDKSNDTTTPAAHFDRLANPLPLPRVPARPTNAAHGPDNPFNMPLSSPWIDPFEAFGVVTASPASLVDELPANIVTPPGRLKYSDFHTFESVGTFPSGYYFGYAERLWKKASPTARPEEVRLDDNPIALHGFAGDGSHKLGPKGNVYLERTTFATPQVVVLDAVAGSVLVAPAPSESWEKVDRLFPELSAGVGGLIPVNEGLLYRVESTNELVLLDAGHREKMRWRIDSRERHDTFVYPGGFVTRRPSGELQFEKFPR